MVFAGLKTIPKRPLRSPGAMEKIVVKRTLRDFSTRGNPWKNRSHEDRLAAMLEICQTQQSDGTTEPAFPRVFRISRGKTRKVVRSTSAASLKRSP